MTRGHELFDEAAYRLALIEFERAYALLPSWKILYNLGQVHLELGEYARAHAALRRYLAEGGTEIPADRRTAVDADLASLSKRVATLSVSANVASARVTVGRQPLGVAPLADVLVDAGEVMVEVSSPGYVSETRVLALVGGDRATAQFDLARLEPLVVTAPQASESASAMVGTPALAGFITTGVLAAGALGTGIGAVAAQSRFETMRTTPIQGSPEQGSADLQRQGKLTDALAITTDVLVVSTVIVGGVSLYLALHHAKSRPATNTSRSVASAFANTLRTFSF